MSIQEQRSGPRNGEPFPLPDYAKDNALAFLAHEANLQISLQKAGEFKPFKSDPLSFFGESPLMEQLLRDSEADQEGSVGNPGEYRRRLIGRIFEDISYGILSADMNGRRAMISPGATVEFFSMLRPRNRKLRQAGSYGSIEGIWVPDAMEVELDEGGEIQFNKVYEFTTDPKEKLRGMQIENSRRVGESLWTLGQAEFELIFPGQKLDAQSLDTLFRINCRNLFFSLNDYLQVAGDLIEQRILPVNQPATQEEYTARIAVQDARFWDLVASDRLTPEWSQYALRKSPTIRVTKTGFEDVLEGQTLFEEGEQIVA